MADAAAVTDALPDTTIAPKPGNEIAPKSAPLADPAASPLPERTFTQKELDDHIERRLAKERRKREDIERRLKVTEELALRGRQESQTPPQKTDTDTTTDAPKRESFVSYEEYIEARAEWRAGNAVDARMKKDREAQDRERQASESKKAGEDFRKRMKDSAKGIDDYDDVIAEAVSSPDSPVSRLSADPIQHADNPARILYHLAQNPEEAERIASLPLGQQAREIWKLDSTFSEGTKAPEKKPSNAPSPIKPVGGTANLDVGMPDPAKEPEKWMKWRKAQIAAKNAPRAKAQ